MSNLRQEMTTGLREFHEVRNRTVKLDKGVYTHDAATMKKDMAGSIARCGMSRRASRGGRSKQGGGDATVCDYRQA